MTSTTIMEPAPPPDDDEPEARPEEADDEEHRRRRRFRRRLLLIAAAGFAVRLVYVLGWKDTGEIWGDALYYHEGANLLADGHGYVHPLEWVLRGVDLPGADHPPGYLTLLAGISLLGFRSFLAHQLISCILGVLGVIALGWAGRRVAGERVGLLAALIVALSPNIWFHDAMVMSESLFLGTTAVVLWAAYRWWDRSRLVDAAVFGTTVGLAALVRSEALLLGPAIALPLLYFQRGRVVRADLRQLALAGGLAALVIAPWVIFNVTRFEHPVLLTADVDRTLVSANCDDVYSGDNTGYWSLPCIEAAEQLTDPFDDASQEGIAFRRVARDYIGDNKGRVPFVAAARLGRTVGLYQPQNQINLDTLVDGKDKGLGQAGLLTWYVVAVAGAVGLVGLRRAGRPIFPLVALVGATAVTVLVTYGSTRFRFPAELAICIPAAVSLDAAIGALAKGRRPEPDPEPEPEVTPEAEDPAPPVAEAEEVPGLASAGIRFAGLGVRPALRLRDSVRRLFGAWQPVALPADASPIEIETERHRIGAFLSQFPRWVVPAAVVGLVVALPLRGLFLTPGAPFEEGFMLAFPERVLEGDIPNKDFLHLYGPGSLWSLAAFFQVLGVDIWVERFFGLLQLVGVISGITVAGYRWGRWPALLGGSVCAVLVMPPVGLVALAWAGGMAFSVWAVIRLSRVFDDPPDERTRRRILLTAGLLAAGALLFRPDLVLALGLPFGAAFLWGLTGKERRSLVTGMAAGLSLYLVHFALAGPGNAINGMFVEVVFKLRPGRTLPFPPDPDELTSFLNRALVFRDWPWPFPALDEPMQVFVWVPLLFAVTGFVLYVGIRSRRAGAPNGWLLFLLGLFALGTMPQVMQRVDTAHLSWVSAVPFGLLPAALVEWYRLRGGRRPTLQWLLPVAPLVLMFVVVPHYSVRWYADFTGQSFDYMTENQRQITNRGRTFYYGRPEAAAAAQELIGDVERLTQPGDKLIVGTGDLRQTPYTETFFYYLLPQLDPGTHHMEMEPGIANAEDSGLADELREADVYIASTLYDDWFEPNTSMDVGSDEPNQVLEDEYCLYKRYGEYWEIDDRHGDGMYQLYLKCSMLNGDS